MNNSLNTAKQYEQHPSEQAEAQVEKEELNEKGYASQCSPRVTQVTGSSLCDTRTTVENFIYRI